MDFPVRGRRNFSSNRRLEKQNHEISDLLDCFGGQKLDLSNHLLLNNIMAPDCDLRFHQSHETGAPDILSRISRTRAPP